MALQFTLEMGSSMTVLHLSQQGLPISEQEFVGLFAGALFARNEAQRHKTSWRDFYVGTAAQGVDEFGNEKILLAGNTKFSCDDDKDCSETKSMRRARRAHIRLKSLFIVGRPQCDQGSGILSGTLQPCEKCRARMRSEGYRNVVVDGDTLIFTFNPATRVCQFFTVSELMRFHGERW